MNIKNELGNSSPRGSRLNETSCAYQQSRQGIDKLLGLFKSGNLPEAVAEVKHPTLDVPSAKWSLSNQLMQRLKGTLDARGRKQWRDVGRTIKPGAKPIGIYAPSVYRSYKCECGKSYRNWELSDLEQCKLCAKPVIRKRFTNSVYFRRIPVFAVEDTEGQPLKYENLPVPKHRFSDVARFWDLDIKAEAFKGYALGTYSSDRQEIRLASPEERVFYHELAHGAQDRLCLLAKGKGKNEARNEIVAEFVAATLCYLNGRTCQLGNSFEYLKHYADKSGKTVEQTVILLIQDIEKVLNEILEAEKEIDRIEHEMQKATIVGDGVLEILPGEDDQKSNSAEPVRRQASLQEYGFEKKEVVN